MHGSSGRAARTRRPGARAAVATIAAVVAIGALAAPATASARPRMLYAKVGDDYSISLRTASGKPVRRIAHGFVLIRVWDASPMQDFHLWGGRYDRYTDIAGTGHELWGVRLRRGRWYFKSDPHPIVLHGSFVVT
jgi:hypothetical protein